MRRWPARRRRALKAALSLVALVAALDARAEEPSRLTPELFEVTLNGQLLNEPVTVLRDSAGLYYVSRATLAELRVGAPSGAPVRYLDEDYYPLSAIGGARLNISAGEQAMAIDLPPESFERSALNLNRAGSNARDPGRHRCVHGL